MKKVWTGELYQSYNEVTPENPAGSVLLMTGLGANRSVWTGHLSQFGQRYRTVALDHRDAGDSDYSPSSYTTTDQASDAAGAIQSLGLAPVHVVGVSMGGFVAMELALNYPQMLRSLVLVCTRLNSPDAVLASPEAEAALERLPGESPLQHYLRSYPMVVAPGYFDHHHSRLQRLAEVSARSMMPDEAYRRQRATDRTRTTNQRIHRLKVPTLIIHGEDDALVPVENARIMAGKIPGAELILYPHCGHLVTMEKPREFARDVLAFFEKHNQL